MGLKPYLQLVRLPNLFTAAADSLAGWLLVGGALGETRHWPWLALASVLIYAGGVALNDVFDIEVDRRERPDRPLPSGRVGFRTAVVVSALLLVLGSLSAWAAATHHGLMIALALVACVIAYDARLKHTALGPEVMGLCRGLNLLLGMSQAAGLGGPAAWAVAAAYALFVTGITWISRSEVDPVGGVNQSVVAGVLVQNVAFLVYLAACVHPELFPGHAATPQAVANRGVEGLLFLLIWVLWVNHHTVPATWTAKPEEVRRALKVCITSLVALHIGLLISVNPSLGLLGLGALWLAAVFSSRWVYAT